MPVRDAQPGVNTKESYTDPYLSLGFMDGCPFTASELDVNAKGSEIKKRGFVDVVNNFGCNCFACHIQARPEWDLVCEHGHGCEPLKLSQEMITAIQKTDPRCEDNPELNDGEKRTLEKLMKDLAGNGEATG